MSTHSGPGYTIEAGPSAYPPKWVPTARPRSSRARSPPLAHSPGTPPRPPAHLKGDFRRQANLSGSKKSFSRIRGNSGFSPVKSILLCLAYLCVIYLIWYVRERTDEIWEMRLGDGIERSGESDMEIRGGESMLNLTGDVGGDEEGGVVEEVKGLEEDEGGGQVIEDEDIAVVGKRRGGGRRKYAPENVRMNAGEEEEEEQEDDERSEAERQKFCDGKEKVVKNALIDDKVTVLLSSSAATWQPQLAKLAQRLSKLPFVHSVQVVLEGWEGKKGREKKIGDYKRHLFSGPNVSVIRSSTGDPNLRFVPRKPVNTTAVLWCLDDLIVDPELLAFSFDVWRANRGTLVGTSPRSHVYENETGTWRYVTDTLPFGAGQFSIIVGSALIFSSNLLYDYACNMPSGVWDFVDEVGDCGDLALNFLAANKSGQAPVLVGGRKAPVHEGGRRSVLSSQMPRETFKKDIAPFVFSKEDVRLSRQLLEINSTNSNATDREPAGGGGWLSFFGWGARKQRENLPLSNLSRKKKGSFLPKRGLSVQKKKQTSELKNMTKNEIQKPPPQMKKARRRRIEEDATLRSQCLNKLIELWGGMPLKWNVGQLSPRETKKPMCERDGELIPCEDNPSGIVTVSRKKGNLNKIGPSPPAQRFAFIFLVFSPELLKIAVVAAQSLRLTGTPHEIVLLAGGNANLNNLDAEHLFLIDQHFTSMRPVSTIRNPHTHNAYSKLHAWSLTEYTRVVYLDIDILILENIDELFNHPGLAAVPDVYESTKFNSGVMVIEPSLATYSKMVSLAGSRTSYNRDDQGFLNPFFESWYSMDIEHRLPFKYNAIIHFPKTYIPPAGLYVNRAHEFLGPLAIIHFANPWFKPWKNRKNSTCSVWCKAWLRVREELAKNEWRKLDPEKFQVLDGIPSPWLDLKNPFAVRRHVREEALKARFQKKKEEVEKREEAEKRKREEALEAQFRKREEVEEREVMGEESMEGENGAGFQENVKMEEEGMSKRGKYGINEKTRDSDETGETGEYRENGTGDNGEKGKSWETREGEEWANVVGNRRRILTASDSLYSSEKLGLFGENSFGIEAEWNKTLNSIDKSVKEETKKDVQVQVEQEGEGEFEKEREEEEDEDEGGEEGGIKKQVWIWERERLPPPIEERMINPHVRQGYSDDAFATLLTREDEAFLLGTWGLSYRQHHRLGKGGSSMRPTLLLVLSTVPEQAWMPYKALFADILVVEPLGIETERRRFAPEFSLLYLWNQVKYERIVFVDALSLFWDNCNGILDWEPFAAVPSALPGDRFNPRTLLLQPDERTFQDMLGKLTSPLYPTDSLENFLNAYFHTWYSSPAPHRMPLSYAVDTMLKPHSMKYVYPWKIISFDPRTPPFSDLSRWKGQPRMFAATKWRMVFCRLRTKLRPNHLRHLCEQKP